MVSHQTITENPVAQELGKVWQRSSWQSKWVLLGAAAMCYFALWWASESLGVSKGRGFDGSLLMSEGAFGNVVLTAAMLLSAVAVGTVLAGAIRPDAGLFAGAFGLMAVANRGRGAYAVLHDAGGGRTVYLILALELVALYALLGGAWFLLRELQRRGRLGTDALRDGLADAEQPPSAGWSALAGHAAIMATFVVILARSEDKKQVLAAVAIGSFFAAFLPYWQPGARPSVWYWAGPLAVGLAGYLLAFIAPPPGTDIGRPGYPAGFLAALVRPLPLDYASIGTTMALLGYWMRRKGLRERELAQAQANTPPEANAATQT
jgi:hypothetical protein